jgi:hypothetical protein
VSGAAAQGLFGGIALAGGGLALAIVPPVEAWIGWSSPYVSGAVVAALAIGLVCLGPPTPGGVAGGVAPRVRALLTDRRLVRLGVLHSATFGFSVVLGAWIVTLLVLATATVGLAAGLPFGPVFTAAARSLPDSPGAAVGAMNLYAVITIVIGAPLLGLAFSLPGDGRIGFAAVALLWAIAGAATGRGVADLAGQSRREAARG